MYMLQSYGQLHRMIDFLICFVLSRFRGNLCPVGMRGCSRRFMPRQLCFLSVSCDSFPEFK